MSVRRFIVGSALIILTDVEIAYSHLHFTTPLLSGQNTSAPSSPMSEVRT